MWVRGFSDSSPGAADAVEVRGTSWRTVWWRRDGGRRQVEPGRKEAFWDPPGTCFLQWGPLPEVYQLSVDGSPSGGQSSGPQQGLNAPALYTRDLGGTLQVKPWHHFGTQSPFLLDLRPSPCHTSGPLPDPTSHTVGLSFRLISSPRSP